MSRRHGLLLVAGLIAAWSQQTAAQVYPPQSNCAAARELYNNLHEAQASQNFGAALRWVEAIRTTVPAYCRLESNEQLAIYEYNLRNLIAGQPQPGLASHPCRPVQVGPTSYACQ